MRRPKTLTAARRDDWAGREGHHPASGMTQDETGTENAEPRCGIFEMRSLSRKFQEVRRSFSLTGHVDPPGFVLISEESSKKPLEDIRAVTGKTTRGLGDLSRSGGRPGTIGGRAR